MGPFLKTVLGETGLEVARRMRDDATAWLHQTREQPPVVPPVGAPPLPPARLVMRVAGTPDRRWFLRSGEDAARSLQDALGRHGVALRDLGSILDFGCGCGRVLRHLLDLPAALHGCDAAAAGVRWCRRNLGGGEFAVTSMSPPLPYADGQFDLVYGLSVFTHFPAELQAPWIDELGRVLRPGGHLLLSFHGDAYREGLSASEQASFAAGNLVVKSGPPGSNRCAAYHPHAYLEALVRDRFEIVESLAEGAAGNPRQDLVVMRKPA